MNYKQIDHSQWVVDAHGETVDTKYVVDFDWSPNRFVKAFGLPYPLPESYQYGSLSGIYLFTDDKGEMWTVYDVDQAGELSNGEMGPSPKEFWNGNKVATLHIGTSDPTQNYDRFVNWLIRRLSGESSEEIEVFDSAYHTEAEGSNILGVRFIKIPEYTSLKNPLQCYMVARNYAEMYDSYWALCSIDKLLDSLKTAPKNEMVDVCKKLQSAGLDLVIINREK